MTLAQTYRCSACEFSFGPVGVRPYTPDAPQVFRYCSRCGQAQARQLATPTEPIVCVHCHADALIPLNDCPKCKSSAGWGFA